MRKDLKVLIVDDEKLICDLIFKLTDWSGLGLRVAGIAYDGLSALELARKENPDIIISDIRMPGIDGLQLVEQVKKIFPETKIILISGYKEFDFAVNALKLGVSDYLLKPISKKQLNETLARIITEISGKSDSGKTKPSSSFTIKKQPSDQTRENLLIQSISRPLHIPNVKKKEVGDIRYIVFILRYDLTDPFIEDDYSEQIHLLSEKMSEEFIAAFEQTNISLIYTISRYETYFLASQFSDFRFISDLCSKTFYDISTKVSFYSNINATMGIGIPISSIEELDDAVDSARMAINERIDKGTGKIINFDDVAWQQESFVNHHITVINDETQSMINHVRLHELDDLDSSWKRIHDVISQFSANYYIMSEEIIIDNLIRKSRQLQISEQNRNMMQDGLLNALYKCCRRKDSWDILVRKLNIYMRDYRQNNEKNLSKTVIAAIAYIEKHYMEKITLNDIADACFINASWLSTKFKNEIGINLTDYINNVRIDMAKLFLISTDYSVNEVSNLVGFTDSKYFSRLFRKVTGITPNEFRKIM